MKIRLFLLLLSVNAVAQTPQYIDSLELKLPVMNAVERAQALYALVSFYQRNDQQKAIQLRNEGRDLKASADLKVRTYTALIEGIYFTGSGQIDSALYWFNGAKKSATQSGDNKLTAAVCSSLGRALITGGHADEAVSNLLEGLRLVDKNPDLELALKLRINLIWAYLELKRYRDGIALGKQSIALLDSAHQWMGLYIYNNLAICYGSVNQLDSAAHFVQMGIRDAEINHDNQSLANAHFILGTIYGNAGRDDWAIKQYELAGPYRQKVGNPFFIVSDLYTLASLYHKTGNYAKGIQTGLEALAVARNHNLLLKFENTYQVLAMNYEGQKDFRKAAEYYQLWASAKDSVYQHANAQAIADMETKYQTEEKEKEILLQRATISVQDANLQRTYILTAALTVVVILIGIILLLYRSRFKKKQEVLKKEYELSLREAFISATIQSQESERKRFAQDLHDGMGQLISALRFMIGQQELSPEVQHERTDRAQGILNEMHKEIRSVAFNLMPQILIKNGLVPALQEMAARLNDAGQLKVTVSSFDIPERFSELQEVSLYRVVQEWVNNIMKYSNAEQVHIQLVGHQDEINLTMEDDGMGFDKKILETSNGNGWKNIQSRLNLIHATVEVDSQPGRHGTTFISGIPIKR